eukprot:1146817-Pelagomonas_calceolata.AAC.2
MIIIRCVIACSRCVQTLAKDTTHARTHARSTGPTPEEVEMLLAAEQAAMEGTGGTVDMASLGGE